MAGSCRTGTGVAKTIRGPRSKPRRARAQERKVATTSKVLGQEFAFFPYRALHHLSFAGVLKAQARCPRPERFAPRSLARE